MHIFIKHQLEKLIHQLQQYYMKQCLWRKKENLQNWKDQEIAADYITQEAAIIGTETHKLIENYINEIRQTDDVRLLSVAHFNNLIPFLQKNQ